MAISIIAVSKKTWAHGRDDHPLSPMTVNGLLLGFDTLTWDLGFVENHFVSMIATIRKDINWFTNSIITLLLLQLQSMSGRSTALNFYLRYIREAPNVTLIIQRC